MINVFLIENEMEFACYPEDIKKHNDDLTCPGSNPDYPISLNEKRRPPINMDIAGMGRESFKQSRRLRN